MPTEIKFNREYRATMAEENYVIAHSGRLRNPFHQRGPNNRMSCFIDFWNNREIKCSKGQKKVKILWRSF